MSQDQKPPVIPVQQINGVQNKSVDVTQTPEFQAAVAKAVADALKGAGTSAAPATGSPALEKYLEVVMSREAREAQAEQEKLRVIAVRTANRNKNSAHTEHEAREKQRRCRHTKGGRLQKAGVNDFNMAMHEFTDGTKRIRCQSCGMKWFVRDTKEFIHRDGKKYRNHTNIGWHEAWQMLQSSTNTTTKSEMVVNVNPRAQVYAAQDTVAQERKATEEELYGQPVVD
jgi:hypothetical protein